MRAVTWVTPLADAAPRSGGAIRTHRLIRGLAARAPVHVIKIGATVDEPDYLASTGAAGVRCFQPGHHRVRERLTAATHRWPIGIAHMLDPRARAAVDADLAADHVVVLDQLSMLGYAPRTGGYVVALQNVDSRVAAAVRPPASPWRRAEHAWNTAALHHQEQRLDRDPRVRLVVVSEEDATSFHSATVIPNGTEVPDAVGPVAADGPVVFIGSLDYGPNVEAVAWWAHEVWPRLDEPRPRLTVAGRGGAGSLGQLAAHESLEVVGEVESTGPLLDSASLVAVPLLSGGGTRLKLLEAMAWGRPIVTTRKGAEGLPLRHGVEALLADDAVAFAAAVTTVRADRALADRLGAAGRALVVDYDWNDLAARFAEVVLG